MKGLICVVLLLLAADVDAISRSLAFVIDTTGPRVSESGWGRGGVHSPISE